MAAKGESAGPQVRVYQGEGVSVSYDPRRCIHFAECVRGLPEVFDVNKRPWIQPAGAPADKVAEVVRRCPSGALHYELDGGAAETPEHPTRIHTVPDGPITIRGELTIETPEGEISEARAAICRCGLTDNQPFCDHECKRSGWKS